MPNFYDPNNPEEMRCSFCGKKRGQVRKFVQGPNGVCICDECIDACVGMIHDP